MQNRNQVRIFLSSTFRDMANERDYIIKTIFPEVRRLARKRRVELILIDLRWGLTAKEAQQGRVLRICLEEINRCKPFFLGFLGERYGWSPSLEDLDHYADLIERFPIVERSLKSSKSITEMEILHGVLETTNHVEAVFYERSSLLTDDFAKNSSQPQDYFDTEEINQQKLCALKERIHDSGFPVYSYAKLEDLGRMVKHELISLLDRLYPESEVLTPLEAERRCHKSYAEDRIIHYVPNYDILQRIDNYIVHPDFDENNVRKPPLLIGGESGLGKSALLSYWLTHYCQDHPTAFVIEYFPGAQGRVRERDVLIRILREVEDRLEDRQLVDSRGVEQEIPQKLEKLSEFVLHKLQEISEHDPLLIILDAVNQIEMESLDWLPNQLPPNVNLIMSVLPSEIGTQLQKRGCTYFEICPLNQQSRNKLVKSYLDLYRKKLSETQLAKIVNAPQCENPLFLTTVLAELQIFGSFERLDELIDKCISQPNLSTLFSQIIHRFEEDYGLKITKDTLTYIWASKKGISETDLMELTQRKQIESSPIVMALDYHLITKDNKLSFSHEFIRNAVEQAYLESKESQRKIHRNLGQFYEKTDVALTNVTETSWQYFKAEDAEALASFWLNKDVTKTLYEDDKISFFYYTSLLLNTNNTTEIFRNLTNELYKSLTNPNNIIRGADGRLDRDLWRLFGIFNLLKKCQQDFPHKYQMILDAIIVEIPSSFFRIFTSGYITEGISSQDVALLIRQAADSLVTSSKELSNDHLEWLSSIATQKIYGLN